MAQNLIGFGFFVGQLTAALWTTFGISYTNFPIVNVDLSLPIHSIFIDHFFLRFLAYRLAIESNGQSVCERYRFFWSAFVKINSGTGYLPHHLSHHEGSVGCDFNLARTVTREARLGALGLGPDYPELGCDEGADVEGDLVLS